MSAAVRGAEQRRAGRQLAGQAGAGQLLLRLIPQSLGDVESEVMSAVASFWGPPGLPPSTPSRPCMTAAAAWAAAHNLRLREGRAIAIVVGCHTRDFIGAFM